MIDKVYSGDRLRHRKEHRCYHFCQGHGETISRVRPRNRRQRTNQQPPTGLVLCSDTRRERVESSWMNSKSCWWRHTFLVPGALATAVLVSFCSPCCGASAGSITRYSTSGTSGRSQGAQDVSSSVVTAGAATSAASATGESDGGESTTTADDVLESSTNQWGGQHSEAFSEEESFAREDADLHRFLYWDQGGTGGERASEGFRQEQRRGDGWRDVRSWRHENLEQVLQELEDTDYGAGAGSGSKGRHRKPRVGVPRSVRPVYDGTVRNRNSGADSRRRSITVHPNGLGENRASVQGMDSIRPLPFATSSASETEETSFSAAAAPGGYSSYFDNREPSELQDSPVRGRGHINDSATRYQGGPVTTSTSTPQSMLLYGDEFSETGSAGTGAWTDPDTEDFMAGNADVKLEHHHMAAYGCFPPQLRQGVAPTSGAAPGPGWTGRATNDQRPLLQAGLSRRSIRRSVRPTLDLDYSAKVLNYGRSSGIGPPKTLTLRSWSRLLGAVGIAASGAFLSVSPNNAPRDEYLALFRRNMWLLAASIVGPALYTFLSYDSTKVNINTYVRVVTFAFTWGYLITFGLEIMTATALQLCVLAFLEPAAFKLTPDVPAIFLPWVLRENGYIPSYLYSFLADLLCFCIASPIVECGIMVWIVRRLGALPERIGPSATAAASPRASVSIGLGSGDATKDSVVGGGRVGTSKVVPSALDNEASTAGETQIKAQHPGRVMVDVGGDIQQPTHVHTYLQYMLGSAMGLKAACTMQRVLWYTKEFHEQKAFFALIRGFFPLYELCGSILAMNLARRDILGQRMNRLQLFFVAVALNAYAVFRGAKPLFKWTSSKPWDELMVKAWVFPKGMTAFQLVRKGFASVAWSLVVLKVTAHVIKTYWKLTRLHSSRLRQQHEMAAAATHRLSP